MRVLAWPASSPGNPYNALLYDALQAARPGVHVESFAPAKLLRDRVDVWHIHWPERFATISSTPRAAAQVAMLMGLVALARRRGIRIVWTVHNVRSHRQTHPRLERRFMEWFSRRVDGVIALTAGGYEAACAALPALEGRPHVVSAHGHYRDAYTPRASREVMRAELGLREGSTVFALVGRLPEYKDPLRFLSVFRRHPDADSAALLAGRTTSETLRKALVEAANRDRRVRLLLEDLDDDHFSSLVQAADVMVMPYQSILNSGSVIAALSLGCAVVAPRDGALPEIERHIPPGWITLYGGELGPEHLAAAAEGVARRSRDRGTARRELDDALERSFGWDRIGAESADFMTLVRGASRG